MSRKRKQLLLILLGIAILLLVLGIAAIPVVQAMDPKTLVDNTILSGIPFILIFIGIIVAFIDFIIWLATRLNNNVSEKVYRPIERGLMAGIVLGVVGMFQPFVFVLYTIGFIMLLLSTLGYIVWSHIVPRVSAEA